MAILAAPTGNEVNLLEVMLHAGPVSKSVLVILFTFSLLSWVVIIRKALLYRRSRSVSEQFRAAFKRATDWRELKQHQEKFAVSPLVGLFVAGFAGLVRMDDPSCGAWKPWSAASSGPVWWKWAASSGPWADWPRWPR